MEPAVFSPGAAASAPVDLGIRVEQPAELRQGFAGGR
jgi:hypothetical protein